MVNYTEFFQVTNKFAFLEYLIWLWHNYLPQRRDKDPKNLERNLYNETQDDTEQEEGCVG